MEFLFFIPAVQSTLVPESSQFVVLLFIKVPPNDKAHRHQDVHPMLTSKCYKVNHGSCRKKKSCDISLMVYIYIFNISYIVSIVALQSFGKQELQMWHCWNSIPSHV